MVEYVIHKKTRLPGKISYNGPTWKTAGVSFSRKDVFREDELENCKKLCKILTEHNPVGFKVSPKME